MPRPYPMEFRRDVVAVARRGEAPIKQVAHDFGIAESCLRNWLRDADVEDGNRPGVPVSESAEIRELRRRNRLLEQEVEVPINTALHMAAVTQLRLGGQGAAYYAKLITTGKTRTEALRLLRRRISDRVFAAMSTDELVTKTTPPATAAATATPPAGEVDLGRAA
ncbi:transposase [Cellulomonas sp.]|uniref:transposase n=1 Tax=Cellulomonas sp. TaxID=40001 RepID=UPI0025826BC9|nr:transposase [Cellulomonas sp.]MCR6688845.1 transposase [Cellulomonas sp.]